ncbi:MAG: hypothetical protein IT223_09045 [Crocinitomicaceae bacterium]|nr:hypothetical protein [Crocinitomicaceae bacterium]
MNTKTMKNVTFSLLLLAFSFCAIAQTEAGQDEKRQEKIERLKRAFISEKLELTVAEAEKFWPVYNEYNSKKKELKKTIRKTDKELREKNGGEKETVAAIDVITKNKREEVDIDDKFLRDSMAMLGYAKVQKLMGIDEEFRRELKERLKERREEKGGGGKAAMPKKE